MDKKGVYTDFKEVIVDYELMAEIDHIYIDTALQLNNITNTQSLNMASPIRLRLANIFKRLLKEFGVVAFLLIRTKMGILKISKFKNPRNLHREDFLLELKELRDLNGSKTERDLAHRVGYRMDDEFEVYVRTVPFESLQSSRAKWTPKEIKEHILKTSRPLAYINSDRFKELKNVVVIYVKDEWMFFRGGVEGTHLANSETYKLLIREGQVGKVVNPNINRDVFLGMEDKLLSLRVNLKATFNAMRKVTFSTDIETVDTMNFKADYIDSFNVKCEDRVDRTFVLMSLQEGAKSPILQVWDG